MQQIGDTIPINVMVRSLTADLPYPISVYAFEDNSDGRCLRRQTLSSSSDALNMSMSRGQYRFVAIAGAEGYTPLTSPQTLSSTIGTDGENFSTVPLMMGSADVSVTNVASTVNILMSYAVASLRVQLLGVPTSVTSATVTVGQQAEAINMRGELSGAEKATLPMRRESAGSTTWTSDIVYLLPGTQGNTVLTITLTDGATSRNYGYTYSKPLAAATPYVMNGTFVDAEQTFAVSGNISVGEWKSPVVIDFEFGDGAENESSGNGENTSSGYYINRILSEGETLWNGHVVAWVENVSATEEDLVLISREEITGIFASAAVAQASSYEEDDLIGWSIPTELEARHLMTSFGGYNIDVLNDLLEIAGGSNVEVSDANGKNIRFICENGAKTYSFGTTSSVTSAGTTVKYSMRLLKRVHVTLQ